MRAKIESKALVTSVVKYLGTYYIIEVKNNVLVSYFTCFLSMPLNESMLYHDKGHSGDRD